MNGIWLSWFLHNTSRAKHEARQDMKRAKI
jgi:hypothetical protein